MLPISLPLHRQYRISYDRLLRSSSILFFFKQSYTQSYDFSTSFAPQVYFLRHLTVCKSLLD